MLLLAPCYCIILSPFSSHSLIDNNFIKHKNGPHHSHKARKVTEQHISMPALRRKNRAAAIEESSESSSGEDDSSSEEDESSEDEEEESSESSSDSSEEGSNNDDGEDEGEYSEEEYDPMADALDALIDSVVDYEDPNECWDYVRQWLREHSIEETKEAVELRGEFDTTALHVACRNRPPVDVVDIMLMSAPDMIFWADSFGWLPVSYLLFLSFHVLYLFIFKMAI